MKDRYFISITTVHGTKHYSVRQIIKHLIGGLLLLVIAAFGVGYFYIDYLHSKGEQLEKEKSALHRQSQELAEELRALNLRLLEKKSQLETLGSKIDDLEAKLQLKEEFFKPPTDIKRLSPQDRALILDLVPSGSPVPKLTISAPFGWRKHPILKKRELHPGIDISGSGTIPIRATAYGIVSQARISRYGYGNVVRINHLFGFKTLYAHLRKIVVKKGDFIKKGDIIGYMGNSGLSTGQHLHYEVRYDSKPLNPYHFIKWSENDFYTIFKKERRVPWESLVKALTTIPSLKRPPSFRPKQESSESSSSTQTSTSMGRSKAK
ncbi:MAG: peptidase M24 [Epsilonproteobacteria bacterium]|nr:peptidase M24 [Campylobacterota bacterium]NPA64082.1 peptidoglycan DD-metalloendopeptidase family protein [Campylobacterota bacterium]